MAGELNRPVPIEPAAQRHTPHTVQSIRGQKNPCSRLLDRLQAIEAKIALVYCTRDNHNRDPIMHMICTMLDDNKDINPDDSIIFKTKLNI